MADIHIHYGVFELTTSKAQVMFDNTTFALVKDNFYSSDPNVAHFLDYVYILEAAQLHSDREGGKTKLILWPHTIEMAESFTDHQRVIVMKGRQLGFSWLAAAFAVWLVLYKEGANVLMISRGELEAQALLAKARYIYDNLPKGWAYPLGDANKSQFSVPAMHSKITALPSTEHAGRSEMATVVIQDEAEFHDHIAANINAVAPTISAGGTIIMGSTVNKWKSLSIFKGNFRGSDLFTGNPDASWHGLFFPWNSRPDRDDQWYQREMENIPEDELEGMSREFHMSGEHPSTMEEALAPAAASSYFKRDILNSMLEYIKKPIETDGHINIYQHWSSRGRYAAGTDTSHGVGRDYNVTIVYDFASGRVVADIVNNEISPDLLGYESVRMLSRYDNPKWAIEDNDWGIQTVRVAQGLKYRRLYHRPGPKVSSGRGKSADEPGWHTNEPSRFDMWGNMQALINAGEVIIPNRQGLEQFFTVITNPEKKGRPEAMSGANDDYPTALAITLQMAQYARKNTGEIAVVKKGHM